MTKDLNQKLRILSIYDCENTGIGKEIGCYALIAALVDRTPLGGESRAGFAILEGSFVWWVVSPE